MKVLLTGASGFIGKNFLELAPKDIEIVAIYNNAKGMEAFVKERRLSNVKLHKCDFTKKEETKRLFSKIGKKWEKCIYLAGNVNVPLSIREPAEDLKANACALINFLQSCGRIERFIYMSSAAVYDGTEGTATIKTKLDPKVPYCISKLMCEQYIKFFSSIGKISSYTILRFGGAYGKYSRKSKFINLVVNEIGVQGKEVVDVYGDGKNTINVMYAKDAVRALLKCLNSRKSNVICNLGQDTMTVREAVERIAAVFGKKVKINYVPRLKEQKYASFRLHTDFNKVFGFKPEYSFEEGVRELGAIMKNES
jgi:nucleoside-diphosphate-sugar epimerase